MVLVVAAAGLVVVDVDDVVKEDEVELDDMVVVGDGAVVVTTVDEVAGSVLVDWSRQGRWRSSW